MLKSVLSCCAGQPTVNHSFGNHNAVLVGDFLFARSSYLLAHLEDNEVSCASDHSAYFASRNILSPSCTPHRPAEYR